MKNFDRIPGRNTAVATDTMQMRFGSASREKTSRVTKVAAAASVVLAGDYLAAVLSMMGVSGAFSIFATAPVMSVETSALLAGLTVLVLMFGGLYRQERWETREIGGILSGAAVLCILHFAFLMNGSGDLSALAVWPVVAIAMIGARMVVRSLPMFDRLLTTDVLLVGTGMDVDAFNYQQRSARGARWNIIAQLDLNVLAPFDGLALADRLDRLAVAYGSRKPITVMILPGAGDETRVKHLIERLSALGRRYVISLDHLGLSRDAVTLRQPVGSDMIMAEVGHSGQAGLSQVAKRVFDLVLAAVVLIFLLPVYLIVGLLLTFEGGPIFFSQIRVGRDGSLFKCLKFRTMRVDAQERLAEILRTDKSAAREWAEHQKLANDPRITRVGKLLRETSLDELPQLFNVMRGDMSFVGPRPIIDPKIEGYESDRDYYQSPEFVNYAACTPGITGLWQVSGRAKTTHRERVRLDRWYARNWSWTLDLLILYKTVSAVVGRSGS